MTACIVMGCTNRAIGLYTWGLYPNGEHNKNQPLCEDHAKELWEKVKGLVQTLKCHFDIKPLDTAKDIDF